MAELSRRDPIDSMLRPTTFTEDGNVDSPLSSVTGLDSPIDGVIAVGPVLPTGKHRPAVRRLGSISSRVRLECPECGKPYRKEGGKHRLCNACTTKAWVADRCAEYRKLVSMLWQGGGPVRYGTAPGL